MTPDNKASRRPANPGGKKDNMKRSRAKAGTRSHKNRSLMKWTLLALLVFIMAAAIFVWPLVLTRSEKDVAVIIPRNATREMVADTLAKHFGSKYAGRVMSLVKGDMGDFSKRYGYYEVKKGTSPLRTMITICRSMQTPRTITINHFRDMKSLAKALSRKIDSTPEEFMKAATDSAFLAEYGLKPEQALSLFLEDSYQVFWSYTPKEVLTKIGANYKRLWSEKNRSLAATKGLTPAEIMTVASITDEETNKIEEKGRIGTLYLNRLNKGMRLQADPTVKYAIGDFSVKRITKQMCAKDSPYNTYRYGGLPPGPIRTSSKSTVEAILKAPASDDLYMCAREDFSGYHNFSSSFGEHMKNALRYQNELNKRDIH